MTSTGFPQPTRPDNSYSPRFPVEIPYPAPQFGSQTSYPPPQPDGGHTHTSSSSPVTAYPVPSQLLVPEPELKGFSVPSNDQDESMEDLKRGIMELYEKLPASIRSKIKLDKYFHVPNDIVADLKADAARSRDVKGIVDQLSPKLERFKVRTVRGGGGGGGVVTPDDDAGDKN